MRRAAVIFGILLLITACQGIKKSDKPDDLISEDKMVDVLTDISLVHGARSYNKDLMIEKGIDVQKYVFEKHDIDSLQYIKSHEYYSENYREFEDIYARVKERLEGIKVEYDSIRVREERRQDSLRALVKSDTLSPDQLKSVRDSLKRNRVLKRDSLIKPISSRDSIRR